MGVIDHSVTAVRNWQRTLRQRYLRPYVFVHINKTGGSSIERALGISQDHSTALEKYRQLGAKAWEQKFVFAVVRNPWDKVVSHYHYRVKTKQTGLDDSPIAFREWVLRCYLDRDPQYYDQPRMFMPQWHWLIDEKGKSLVDFVGRFENLNQDFATISDRLSLGSSLGHVKPSSRGSYQNYYNEETQALIEASFAEDIDAFGYRF
ncbi:MAG: chondroitin 4-sulfotransferase 11 [Halioglobus sp.]|jgi:chondroitin 4-sulfotransferase 11